MSVIPAEGVEMFWPQVEGLLAPAMAYSGGRLDLETVQRKLAARQSQLWVVFEDETIRAAFVTREAAYPKRRLLAVDVAGGAGMRQWLDLVQQTFRNFARDIGVSGVELYGRPGWWRALRAYGWTQRFVVLEVSAAAPEN